MLVLARLHSAFLAYPSHTLATHAYNQSSTSGSGPAAAPAFAIGESGSEMLALVVKLVLLAALACALYARRSRPTLARTPRAHALVVLLFTFLPLPFWLFWLFALPQPQPNYARDPFAGTSHEYSTRTRVHFTALHMQIQFTSTYIFGHLS